MEKGEFFALAFEEKLQFICMIRHRFSRATTNEEKAEAFPQWLSEKAKDLAGKNRFEDMGALFPYSIPVKTEYEDDVEILCIMDEIINDLLYLSILEMENGNGLS